MMMMMMMLFDPYMPLAENLEEFFFLSVKDCLESIMDTSLLVLLLLTINNNRMKMYFYNSCWYLCGIRKKERTRVFTFIFRVGIWTAVWLESPFSIHMIWGSIPLGSILCYSSGLTRALRAHLFDGNRAPVYMPVYICPSLEIMSYKQRWWCHFCYR